MKRSKKEEHRKNHILLSCSGRGKACYITASERRHVQRCEWNVKIDSKAAFMLVSKTSPECFFCPGRFPVSSCLSLPWETSSPVHARPARTQTLFFWKPCSLQIQRCVAEQTFPRCHFWQCYLQGHPFSVMATFILTADILSFCFVGFDNIKIVSVASLPLPEDCHRYSAVKATHSFSNGPQNSLEGIWADLTVRKKPPSIFSRRRWETD